MSKNVELYGLALICTMALVVSLVQCSGAATPMRDSESIPLKIEKYQADALFLKWQAGSGESTYRVYAINMTNAEPELLAETKYTSYVDKIGCSKLRYYRIAAVTNGVESMLVDWTEAHTEQCEKS